MNDRPVIIIGLALFLAVVTYPVWYNVAAGTSPALPAVARVSPVRAAIVRGTGRPTAPASCIAPAAYMRVSHTRLLAGWRDDVVRRADRRYTAFDGHRYEKNLTATCFGCHDDKATFCDRCHEYVGVNPTCTDCHVVPAGPAIAGR